jgi:hypothetical protein
VLPSTANGHTDCDLDSSHACTVRDLPFGAGLFALRRFAAGDAILTINGRMQSGPTRYSIQLDVDAHIEADAALPESEMRTRHPWRFLNHSCEPNAGVAGRRLVALRSIEPGDQLTFDYTTTEADMAEPFDCHCGAAACIGRVRGFAHLSDDLKRQRAARIAPHLRALIGAAR